MVYFSFSLIIVFIGLQLFQQQKFVKQEYITFYSINRHSAMEYTIRNSVYFISDSALKQDWSMMLFNVNNHWNSHNILRKVFFDINKLPGDTVCDNLLIKNNLISFGGKTIWVYNPRTNPIVEPDYVWINQYNLKGLSTYLRKTKPKIIVLDSSIPKFKQQYFLPLIDTNETEVILLDKKVYKLVVK